MSLSARIDTPPRRAMASASCGEQQDSSAMIGTVDRSRDLGQAVEVPARHRLLDEVEVGRARGPGWPGAPSADPSPDWRRRGARRRGRGPRGGAARASTSSATGCAAGLDLEDAVAARPPCSRASAISASRIGDRERPRERHAVAHAAAEQAMDGNAERAAVEVPERHLDRGAREGIALDALAPSRGAAPRSRSRRARRARARCSARWWRRPTPPIPRSTSGRPGRRPRPSPPGRRASRGARRRSSPRRAW